MLVLYTVLILSDKCKKSEILQLFFEQWYPVTVLPASTTFAFSFSWAYIIRRQKY